MAYQCELCGEIFSQILGREIPLPSPSASRVKLVIFYGRAHQFRLEDGKPVKYTGEVEYDLEDLQQNFPGSPQ